MDDSSALHCNLIQSGQDEPDKRLCSGIKGQLIGFADRMRGNRRLVGEGANTISAVRRAN
jgi:hypothetical protein